MGSLEVEAARRRAELLWQKHTREVEAKEAAVRAKWRAAQQDDKAKTARLRALRLAAEQRAAEHAGAGGPASTPKPRRR